MDGIMDEVKCSECGKPIPDNTSCHGFCGQSCLNKYMFRKNMQSISFTGMTAPGGPDIHTVLRSGKMHGIVRLSGVNFAIVCDQQIDPAMFSIAAKAFIDVFKSNGGK